MTRWFKVCERAPEQQQRVLVFCGGQVMAGQFWEHEPGVHDGDTGFCDCEGNDIFPVTHWADLPAGPSL